MDFKSLSSSPPEEPRKIALYIALSAIVISSLVFGGGLLYKALKKKKTDKEAAKDDLKCMGLNFVWMAVALLLAVGVHYSLKQSVSWLKYGFYVLIIIGLLAVQSVELFTCSVFSDL